jgi:hypothetical protein
VVPSAYAKKDPRIDFLRLQRALGNELPACGLLGGDRVRRIRSCAVDSSEMMYAQRRECAVVRLMAIDRRLPEEAEVKRMRV